MNLLPQISNFIYPRGNNNYRGIELSVFRIYIPTSNHYNPLDTLRQSHLLGLHKLHLAHLDHHNKGNNLMEDNA